ncbi:MAG: HAMP domain-containing histidine kinase [Bacteroidales bacterium]|nr:HAMP domain-containing histidine kinase [Bacteroidales bacterium]
MKLLKKINRYYILSSIIVFAFGLLALYITINSIAASDATEGLEASANRIVTQIEKEKPVSNLYPIIEINSDNEIRTTVLKDTSIYDPVVGETELFKELNIWKSIHGKIYHITVRALTVEKTDVVMSVFLATAVLLLLLVTVLYFINKKTASAIWKPFYINLEKLKSFSLQDKERFSLNETPIAEFNELNQSINKLTDKVKSDYNSLKEFTENASHELQTPLAVIQAKTENMLNSENLTKEQVTTLNSVLESISKLEKLNSTLLLMTKIENEQFSGQETISFMNLIRENLDSMKELFEMRGIKPTLNLKEDFTFNMNASLAQIMVINLLKNALVHTDEKGDVEIEITKNQVVFSNFGKEILKNSDKIFERFYKETANKKSTGLGLSLVSKICEVSKLEISYSFSASRHCFSISKK